MTHIVILDGTANLVDSLRPRRRGPRAPQGDRREDPDEADEYALLTYDDKGQPVGEAVVGSDLSVHA